MAKEIKSEKIEKDFQTEFRQSVFKYCKDFHYYKIPDPRKESFAGKKTIVDKRPYDCYVVIGHGFYAFELKFMNKLEAFNFNRIENHQYEALRGVAKAGGEAYIVFGGKMRPTEKQCEEFGIGDKIYNFSFAINSNNIEYFRKSMEETNNMSIPTSFIVEMMKLANSDKTDHRVSFFESGINLKIMRRGSSATGKKEILWRVDKCFFLN